MELETAALADLHHAERNARIHPEAQITELMRAVEMFGQTRPLVVDEANQVLVGNGLLTALQRLERPDARVLRLPSLTEAEKIKLMLSDNKIFELGIDDYQAIMAHARSLDDLDVPGFDSELLATLIDSDIASQQAAAALGEDVTPRAHMLTATPVHLAGETQVTCPHCGAVFRLGPRQ